MKKNVYEGSYLNSGQSKDILVASQFEWKQMVVSLEEKDRYGVLNCAAGSW